MIQTIPAAAVILLNSIVLFYVWRERHRTRSGLFLALNALALILWTLTLRYETATEDVLTYYRLTAFASSLIPVNLLIFAVSRPTPISPVWRDTRHLYLLFIPIVFIPFMTDYGAALRFLEGRIFIHASWRQLWAAEGGVILLLNTMFLTFAIVGLAVRYNTADSGPERNLPRHLLLSVGGPVLFSALFSILSSPSRVALIPSPALVLAVIAQLSILAVIRQEEVLRPLYLSRWIYYSIIVLIGFILSIAIYTIYEAVSGAVLLTPTIHLTIAITTIVVLTAGSLPPVQAVFDRLMFSRAWEYRQLVREAQTELNETRQRLRQAERLSVIGEMAARIAHEIKNPLGPIKGYTQMMREKLQNMDDFPERESFLRKLAIVSEEVESIDGRVRHLLDIARKPAVEMQREDVNKIVNRAATLLRLEAETLQGDRLVREELVFIEEDLAPSLPDVVCSRTLIEEALFNLCRNAFEAIGGRGRIRLRTRARVGEGGAEGVEIVVEDDGLGISEEALRHLYEPFYTEKRGGTGLGLSIVKGHIETHRGTLSFVRGSRRGTTVTAWLPLRPQSDRARNDTAPADSDPQSDSTTPSP